MYRRRDLPEHNDSNGGPARSRPEIADTLFELAKYEIIDFAIILMDASACITSWNAGAAQIFQYTEAEVLGMSSDMIFTSEDRQNQQPEREREEAKANRRAEDERLHVRKDGSRFMASGVLTALRDSQGELRGYAKVLRDVTDRLKADQILQQARHYDALAVLAGGVAHDFNNLLTSILGNTSLALDQLPSLAPTRNLLEAAVKSSQRAAELTRYLLAYAGKGRFVLRRLELTQIISEPRSVLERSIRQNLQLEFSLAGGLPEFLGDPLQIEDVILNLVVNAAEAMESQPGKILISSGCESLDRAQLDGLSAGDAKPGHFVYCEVVDHGVGMDDNALGRIFEPFFTTKMLGRGLGLAAVSGIVRQCKGAIRVSSRPKQGSTFRVLFPALPAMSDTSTEPTPDTPDSTAPRPRP